MKLGRYEVLATIGHGAMGVVVRARAPGGGEVAIKVLKSGASPASVERFHRERRLLASLGEAEGFVPLLDHGASAEGPYIVMPVMEGGSLAAKLADGGLGVAETVALGRALASAMGRAHALGIIHRDLKPENILFTADGRPLIADLGLGKHFGEGASASVSKSGTFLGTVGYMAPEQARDAKRVGPPADVFSLGAILYRCATGVPAFDGETLIQVFALVAEGRFRPVGELAPGTPAWLDATITRALAPDPAVRFRDGLALAAALGGESGGAGARPRILLAALGALVVSLLLVASGVLVARRTPRGGGAEGSVRPPPAAPPAGAPPLPAPPKRDPGPQAPVLAPLDLLRGFRQTEHTRLAWCYGSYAWKFGGTGGHIEVSTDGKRLLTDASDDPFSGVVRLWDSATGEELAVLLTGGVHGLALSPDGRRVLTLGMRGAVAVWDLAKARDGVLSDPTFSMTPALHPGSASFISGGEAVFLGVPFGDRVWNLRTNELRKLATTTSVAVELEPGRLLVGATDQNGKGESGGILDLATGALEPIGPASRIVLSRNGARALVLGLGNKPCVWELPGRTIEELPFQGTGYGPPLAIDAEGHQGVVATLDDVEIFDLDRRERIRVLTPSPGQYLSGIAIAPDGTRVFGTGRERLVAWDTATTMRLDREVGFSLPVSAVAFLPDGQRLLAASVDGTARILDAATARELATLDASHAITSVGVADDGTRADLLTEDRGTHTNTLIAWDLSSNTKEEFTTGRYNSAGYSPDGRLAVVRSSAGLSIGDVTPGSHPRLLRELTTKGRSTDVMGAPGHVAVTAGARFLLEEEDRVQGKATGLDLVDLADGSIRPFASTGEVTFTLSADGARAYVAVTGQITVRSIPDSVVERTIKFPGAPGPLAVSRDGSTLVIARGGKSILLLDVATGALLDTIDLATSTDSVRCLAFAPDGKSFVAGTARGVLLRFDLH